MKAVRELAFRLSYAKPSVFIIMALIDVAMCNCLSLIAMAAPRMLRSLHGCVDHEVLVADELVLQIRDHSV